MRKNHYEKPAMKVFQTPEVQRTDAMNEWFKHPVIGKTMTNE